jgi:signal transduction histidine kinase
VTAVPLPRPARLLVVVTVAAGGACAGAWATAIGDWDAQDALACLVVFLATAVSERLPLVLQYRDERAMFSLSDAIWTGSLLVVSPSALALGVGGGVLLGQAMQRRAPIKIAFNVGQFLLSIGAAIGVFVAFGSPAPDEPAGWLAAALAMAAFQAVNSVLVSAVIAQAERRAFGGVLLASTGATHWAGNVSVGILGALVWSVEPLALPLLLVPLGLTALAYRGWLRTLQERDWMDRMGQSAHAIARGGDLGRRIAETAEPGAVSRLAGALNSMLDRVEAAFLRERTFLRESSHELRNPITICRGHLELIASDTPPAELAETLSIVLDELDRMTRILDDMGDVAYLEDPATLRRSAVAADRLLADAGAKAFALLGERLRVEPATGEAVSADPQRLTQALINLLTNARDHTPPGSPVVLRAGNGGPSWRFEVADAGGGLEPGAEREVFQPFVKRLDSGGSGLGLAVVSSVARAHGGRAGVDNRPGEGATFWLEVPR